MNKESKSHFISIVHSWFIHGSAPLSSYPQSDTTVYIGILLVYDGMWLWIQLKTLHHHIWEG